MKSVIKSVLGFACVSCVVAAATLPQLHKIKRTTLKAPYSCKGSYEKSALFLTEESKTINSPDLLYNGACNSGENYIEASTAGDDFSLISDLGEVSIEEVTTSKAFNYQGVAGQGNAFKKTADLQEGHVYVVLSSKSNFRSLVAYKVIKHDRDGELVIDYAVKSYSLQADIAESQGFDWEAKNTK